MAKFVHCADMHFDTPFADLPPHIAEIRRGELLTTFERIIDKTADFGADCLLIAGDVFENEYVSYKTVEFMKRCFAKIPDIPVFIAPGNHDAIEGNEIYHKISLGENVTVFGEGIKCFTFEEKAFRIYGRGFLNKYERSSGGLNIKCPDDGLVNIFITHCSLPPYREERFFPLTEEDIEKTGLDYLAAGHIHNHEGFKKTGKTTYAYCGIPEGRQFDEAGKKGIVLGEISPGKSDFKFVPMCTREFMTKEVDISTCLTYDDILSKMETEKDNIYRIILTGEKNEEISFDTTALESLFSERVFYAKVVDKSKEAVLKEPGLMEKAFIKKLHEKCGDEKTVSLAAKFGVSALRGRQVGNR